MTESKFVFNGFNYYCLIKNSVNTKCNPIIMLSGAFQDVKSWSKYIEKFNSLSTIIIIDLPGSGKSDILPYHYEFDFLVSVLFDLFNKLNIKKAEMMTASYSTPIGFLFSEKHPELISHLILIGTMKEFPKHMVDSAEKTFTQIEKGNIDSFSKDIVSILMNFKKKDKIKKYDAVEKILYNKIKSMDEKDKYRYIENTKRLIYHSKINFNFTFNVPVLVFTGEYDFFTTPKFCKDIAKLFNNSIFTTIKDSDHLCGIEQFEPTMSLMTNFLTDNHIKAIEGCNNIEKITKKNYLQF